MNKKEVAEIKKQFTPDRCAITRICGCYVNAEKEKQLEMKEAFLSLMKKCSNILIFSARLFPELSERIF